MQRGREWFVIGGAALVGVAGIVACVGDDPTGSPPESPGADGSAPGTDASNDTGTAVDANVEDGAVADAAKKTKDPSSLAGVTLWFRADKEVNADAGTVMTWNDQSGKMHHAFSTTAPPRLKPNAFTNGLPAVEFPADVNGAGGAVLGLEGTIDFGTNDYLAEMVVKTNAAPNATAAVLNHHVRLSLANPGDGFSVEHDGVVLLSTPTKVTGGEWHVVAARRKGQTLQLRRDGQIVATQTSTDAGAPLASAGPGYIGANYWPLNGDLAELLLVVGATADDDVDAVEAHFAARYGL